MRYRAILNYFESFSLFVICFPGVVKMIIRVDSFIINIFAFICYVFIGAFLKSSRLNRIYNFQAVIASFFLVIGLSIFFHPGQIDAESIVFLVKGFIYLITGLVAYHTFTLDNGRAFINLIVIFSFFIIVFNFIYPIDHSVTRSNYLIFSFMLGLAAIVLTHDLFLGKNNNLMKLSYVAGLVFIVFNILLAGGRGTLIFTGLCMFIMLVKKAVINKLIFVAVWLPLMTLIVGFSTWIFVKFLNVNSWTLFKLLRLFRGDITEEPRHELYSNALTYMYENPNFFGLGFHASRYIKTSWDNSLPYLESFPLELIFNFGVFGLIFVFYIFGVAILWLRKLEIGLRVSNIHFFIFLFVLMNFSKSWSVYAGLSTVTLLGVLLAVYRYER
jgi:hypothetical protein